MKKFLTVLLAAILLLGVFAATVSAADVAPGFSEKFFPEGKANAPADIYYEIKKDDEGRTESVYLWLTQPEDVLALLAEWEHLGDDEFVETYGCVLDSTRIQVDCKVDDGDWHYMSEWDKGEYPQEDQPYDLTIRQYIWASEEQKTYREGAALIDPWYGQDDESAGYLKPVIYTEDDGCYLDFENHSLTLRLRYFICYRNDNMTEEELDENDRENRSFILSDWSEEITIGKNATQAELVYPETIEAPVLSDLTFVDSDVRGDGIIDTTWKMYVDFPKSNGDAERYYCINMDSWDSLYAVVQYRVKINGKWGEWQDTNWGNPTWLFSEWKTICTEGVSADDSLEFRVYLINGAEEGKNSKYSNSLFHNVDPGDVSLGDVDRDGRITTTDARLTLQFAAKKIDENALSLDMADVDGDGKITTTDARLILQRAAKKIDKFPAEQR